MSRIQKERTPFSHLKLLVPVSAACPHFLGKLGSALGEGLAFGWGVCAWALSVAPGAVSGNVHTAGEENL